MERIVLNRKDQGQARVAIDADLMLNHIAADALETEDPVALAFDSQGNPMVFAIGSKRTLNLIYQQEGSETGWKLANLSATLGARQEVAAFQVAQDQTGAIRLAVAVHPKGQPEKAALWLTDALDHNLTGEGWERGDPGWKARPHAGGEHRISRILLGTNDDGNGAPIVIVATVRGNIREHFLVNGNPADSSWLWQAFQIPQNPSQDFIDMAIGTIQGERGVYTLYDTATGRALTFTTLPDGRHPGELYYDFALPAGSAIAAIAALPPAPGGESSGSGEDWWDSPEPESVSFDLFCAGKGMFVFEGSKTGKPPICLADGSEVRSAQSLEVRRDDGHIAIWAIEKGNGRLNYVLGKEAPSGRLWHTPIPLRQGVARMAAMRNPQRRANELVVAGHDGTLFHLWQDPQTTGWRESEIPVPATGELLEFESYTSVIKFQVASPAELIESKIEIKASDWVRVTINGAAYTLGPAKAVEVTMDIAATVTIIQRADGIQPPTYLVKADFLADSFEVDPGQKILAGVEGIQSGADLKKAYRRNGKQVLDRDVDPGTLDQVAKALGQLTGLARNGLGAERAGVGYRAGGGNRLANLDASGLSGIEPWGLRFDKQRRPIFEADGRRLAAPSGVEPGRAQIGDFFESLARGLLDVTSFVVRTLVDGAQKIVQFVFEVAGKWFEFVIETLGHVFDGIYWFLKDMLGIDLAVVLEWLGQLLDWGEVKATQQVMVDMANRCLDYGAAGLDKLADKVDGFFLGLIDEVKRLNPAQMPAGAGDLVFKTGQTRGNPAIMIASDPSPMGNWSQYHLKHGRFGEAKTPKMQPTDPLMRFINETLVGLLDTVQDTVGKIGGQMQAAFEGGQVSPAQLFTAIGTDVLVGLIDMLRKLAIGIIRLLADLVKLLRQMVNSPLDIPVITALYKGIYKNPSAIEAPYADFTLLNGIAFLVAAPATWICKAVTGKAPFGSGIQAGREADYSRILSVLPGI